MGNYSELKAAINAVIKTNGNNEITGAILQNVLNSMISTIGANRTYSGIASIATNPGTPDQNVFYLASTPGTYVNFGGIILNRGEIALLLNSATNTWSKSILFSGGTNGTIQPNAQNGGYWNERILAVYLKVSDNLYYAPASGSKSETRLTVNVYSHPDPNVSDNWTLLSAFVWNGDTSIDQYVRIETSQGVMWVNPSKFDLGNWNSEYWNKGGFDFLSINKKSPAFIAMEVVNTIENIDIPNTTIIPVFEKLGYYNLDKKFQPNNSWTVSEPIPVTLGDVYKLFLGASKSMGAIMNVDADGNLIDVLQWGQNPGGTNPLRTYIYEAKTGVEYIAVGTHVSNKSGVYINKAQPWLKNLFRRGDLINIPVEWITGHYIIRSNGAVGDHVNYHITDFIEISEFVKEVILTGNISTGLSENTISFYNANKTYISGWFGTGNEVTVIVPENTVYIRLSSYMERELNLNYNSSDIIQELITEDSNVPYDITSNLVYGYIDAFGQEYRKGTAWTWAFNDAFIPVTPGFTYYFSGTAQAAPNGLNLISFYAKANQDSYIDGLVSPLSGASVTYKDEPIVVPDNAKYARFSGSMASMSANFKFIGTFQDLMNLLQREIREKEEQTHENTFVIPAFVDMVIGRTNDVYLDGMTTEPDENKVGAILINGNDAAAQIQRMGIMLRHIPVAASTNTTLRFSRTDAQLNELFSVNTIFRPVSKAVGNGTDQKNICISGDSLVAATTPTTEMYRMLNEDADFVFNQIGTRGSVATSLHEGRGSWSWQTYINPLYENTPFAGTTNAFMIDGALNFQKYMQKYFPGKSIDYFIMALGTNDVTQGSTVPSETRLQEIIAAAKVFIDAFFDPATGYPNAKFAVGLPGVGAPIFPFTNTRAETFKRSIGLLNQKYIEVFDNGKYHANLTTVMHGAYIDRYNGYPYVDEPINDLLPTFTVRRFTNAVHPQAYGYKLWGRGYYGKIRSFIAGNL